MRPTQKTMNELYQHLGKLFYAVAVSDGSVHPKEWGKVREIVNDDWLIIDDYKDQYGTDAARQIEIVFDGLMEYGKTSEECFEEFRVFYKEHAYAFSDEIISLTRKTANAIANAFGGKNKSELIVLGRFELLVKK